MTAATAEVCVIGAGLAGATAALALARAGVDVLLVDQDERPLNRASLRNEGKIHLGFVFAKDDTLVTPKLMLDGALTFRAILRRLVGARFDEIGVSTPFTYLVADDSLVSPEDLAERYHTIAALYRDRCDGNGASDYLGYVPTTLFRPVALADLRPAIATERLIGAFQTEERAVDTAGLAMVVRGAVEAAPGLRFLPAHRVAGVERLAGHFRIVGQAHEGSFSIEAGQVINATWEQRLRIDRTIGLEPPAGWVHRLKYRVIAKLPEALRGGPSVTMVLGPYGDVVVWPGGTGYFSWYPRGLKGWSHEIAPPDAWDGPCRGVVDAEEAGHLAAEILGAIGRWYPGAAGLTPRAVDAGAIVAYGETDVGDPKSGLHDRTRVGVASFDGYHTVDPGKLTTAPLFGAMAAQRVSGRARVIA